MDNVQGKSFYPHGKLHPGQTTYLERLQARRGFMDAEKYTHMPPGRYGRGGMRVG